MGDSISEVSNLAFPAMEAIPLTVVGGLRCSDPAPHGAAHHAAVRPPPSRIPQAPLVRSRSQLLLVAGFQDCPADLSGRLDASELARVAQTGALIAPTERPPFDAWRCSAAHFQQLPAAHELPCVASSPRQAGGAVV